MNTHEFTLSKWIFETIRPFLNGRVVELESEKGKFSSILVGNGITVHLSDMDRNNREILREKFKGNPSVRYVHKFNLYRSDFEEAYASDLAVFNTVLNLNGSTNASDCAMSIAHAGLLLKQDGYLILQTPAYTASYNDGSEDWEELKRYNRKSLKKLIGAGYDILQSHFFNLPAISERISPGNPGLSAITVAIKK